MSENSDAVKFHGYDVTSTRRLEFDKTKAAMRANKKIDDLDFEE